MQRLAGLENAPVEPVVSNSGLPLRDVFSPLGFPLEITTNSAPVLQAAHQSWGLFSKVFDEQPVRLRVDVSEDAGEGAPGVPVYRAHDHLFSIVSGPGNFITCDCNRGLAFGWLSQFAIPDAGFLRYYFLEAAVYSMIRNLHLAALHGALVARNGRGVLLCGNSFAGKSTLSYACARAGWTFVSDDGTFLPRRRADRYAIGNPHSFRLREDATRLFPELRDRAAVVRPNGKLSIEVATSQLPEISIAPGCVIDHIVFLNRQKAAGAHLTRHGADQALHWCEQFANFGDAAVREAQRAVYRRLMSAAIWELRYQDLDAALQRLEQLVRGAD